MEKTRGQQTSIESNPQLVEQIKTCLRAGDYSRVLDLSRAAAAEFPNDSELAELEKLAHDGVKRNAEANRLITESQELFAQQKSVEAIQLLRKAYELDKNNSLARSILANALVEHAQSMVEADWLQAETLATQALAINPAHPTAKSILSLVMERKKNSSVDDWVSQARKLQSSGDLFAALAWIAEGLAVHENDPRLLQIHDQIQRDQGARRRQARRRDLEDLRRMEREIDGTADTSAKQALAERIQGVAAKYWTDGEFLTIANGLLHRLGLLTETSTASPHKSAAVILHVPRFSAAKPSAVDTGPASPGELLPSAHSSGNILATEPPPIQTPSSQVLPSQVLPSQISPREVVPNQLLPNEPSPISDSPKEVLPKELSPSQALATPSAQGNVANSTVPPSKIPLKTPLREKAQIAPAELQLSPRQAATVPAVEPSTPAVKVASPSSSATAKQPTRSNLASLVVVSAAVAIVAVAGTLFFTRKHNAPSVAQTQSATPAISAPTSATPSVPVPNVAAPTAPAPVVPDSAVSATSLPVSAPTPASPQPDLPVSSNPATAKVIPNNRPPSETGHHTGMLLVVASQDGARVFLDGKLQSQLTQAGQLRLPNLDLRDYVVQVSKSGFQDPPPQTIRISEGKRATLIFNLQPQPQPQPRLASLTIQGGAPGTTVLVDQDPVGTIQPDGTLSVPAINPGDHTVELHKERFQPRQFKEHFLAGGAISLAAADATLQAAPTELKITFAPPDAKVAIAKGDALTMVSSGVPLNLAPGTYTLTARTADRFTRSSTLEIVAGQSRTLDLPLAPTGMSKWDDASAWKQENDSFIRKGGDFVLYGVTPALGTFVFSAMPAKGRLLQWVLNYTDPKNYILFQMDDNNFYRAVVRNGEKTDEIKIPAKGERKTLHALRVRVSPTELVHLVKDGDSWTVVDRWTQSGANLGSGKFGFYIPGSDEVALSSFAFYPDLNLR